MRIAKLLRCWFIAAPAALFLCGCSTSISSKPATLSVRPGNLPPITVQQQDIDTHSAKPADTYGEYSADTFSALSAACPATAASPSPQPLRLQVALSCQPPADITSDVVGISSLFIPPLAFVPDHGEFDYKVDYTLTDVSGHEVYNSHLTETVSGGARGWYLARIWAGPRLLREEGKFVAENSATLVLNDIYRHAPEILNNIEQRAEAARARQIKTAPAPAHPAEPIVETGVASSTQPVAAEKPKSAVTIEIVEPAAGSQPPNRTGTKSEPNDSVEQRIEKNATPTDTQPK